jgi:hypothetical protein
VRDPNAPDERPEYQQRLERIFKGLEPISFESIKKIRAICRSDQESGLATLLYARSIMEGVTNVWGPYTVESDIFQKTCDELDIMIGAALIGLKNIEDRGEDTMEGDLNLQDLKRTEDFFNPEDGA